MVKLPVGISNRHCHLTKEVFEQLFDGEMTKKADLKQPGEFACEEVLTIETEKGSISNVRVLGPYRSYSQVEISTSDAFKLGVKPPVRKSGNIELSESVTLMTDKGRVTLSEGLIIANRHIHMNQKKALELGVVEDQKVSVHVEGPKGGTMDAYIKITEEGYFEIHMDRDDASAFMLNNNDEILLEI